MISFKTFNWNSIFTTKQISKEKQKNFEKFNSNIAERQLINKSKLKEAKKLIKNINNIMKKLISAIPQDCDLFLN